MCRIFIIFLNTIVNINLNTDKNVVKNCKMTVYTGQIIPKWYRFRNVLLTMDSIFAFDLGRGFKIFLSLRPLERTKLKSFIKVLYIRTQKYIYTYIQFEIS